MASTSTRPTPKRTFSDSDSSSHTERHLCSFSHLWIINYLSSYLDDPQCSCLQSEPFSPVNSPYSNTRWSLKLYPRGLNEKQQSNNHLAIFLKYLSGGIATIKAKAEFSVVNRTNELVMLRSTNFHSFASGNDWGYSEFLDGNYLNSRRSELLADDRLRIHVRVILVDEKESLASSSSGDPSEREREKSLDLFSGQLKSLIDGERFTDVQIHVIPRQCPADDHRRSLRITRNFLKRCPENYAHVTPLATFGVHRALLIARSSSFAHHFRDSTHNLKLPPIDFYIDDLEPSTVKAMLLYIYTGRLPTIDDDLNPIDLFRAAVKYNLSELRDLAKSTMLKVLKIDNAIEMLEVSDQAKDASLKHRVFSFIRSNASAVSKTHHWFKASQCQPHLIIDAFRSLVSTTKLNEMPQWTK